MATTTAPARCGRCECLLARDHADHLCSPCVRRLARQRWASASTEPVIDVGAEELAAAGVATLIERHRTTAAALIASLLATGALPRHLRRYEQLLVRLCSLDHLSHSAAARELRVTRWTVAAWRQRLGIIAPGVSTPATTPAVTRATSGYPSTPAASSPTSAGAAERIGEVVRA